MSGKPLTLIVKEYEEKLVKEINNSKLSPFIWKNILEKIYNELTYAENQEIENYNNSLKEKKEEKDDKTNA